jgi:hypothetical protein
MQKERERETVFVIIKVWNHNWGCIREIYFAAIILSVPRNGWIQTLDLRISRRVLYHCATPQLTKDSFKDNLTLWQGEVQELTLSCL